MEDVYMTIKELATYLRVKQSTVYNWLNSNRVPASKVVGQWRFRRSEIDEWVKSSNNKHIEQINGQKLEDSGHFCFDGNNRSILENHGTQDDNFKKAIEKRRLFRLVKKFPVRYNLRGNPEKIFKATGRNISEGGIFIEAESLEYKVLSSLKANNRKLRLVLELAGEAGTAVIYSEIAWLSQESLFRNKVGMGLKFFNVPSETSSRISSYILKYSTSVNGQSELPSNFPIRLESSIVIKKKQEEVYNLLKDIKNFPEFIESITSVEIIEEEENKLISDWSAVIDGLEVTWRQEDVLDEEKAFIRFRMLDGDFEKYIGQWSLQQLLTGTELKLTLVIDWGMPNLTRYTEPALREKINNFFQEILTATKKKLWTVKISKLVKFACIVHTTDVALFSNAINEPELKYKNRALLERTFEWTSPFKCSNITGLHSKIGKKIDGELLMCTLLPEQILDLGNKIVLSRVIEAARLAEKKGAAIIGLGAYLAGVGKRGILIKRALNVPVTTGSNYTIAITIEGVLEAAKKVGIDLTSANVTIIGATGSIGRICAQSLSTKVKQLILVARNEVRLNELASLLRPLRNDKEVEICTEMDEAISSSDVIITATNSPYALIDTKLLQPGSVVCDISLPKNISEEEALRRKDILVIDGGLVKPPGDVDFHFYYGLPPGLTYACMAETMILASEGKFESYSLGGNVSLEKVREISNLGKKHGFSLAKLRSFGKVVSEERINEVRNIYMDRKGLKK